jgi:hypothetical protein
VQEIAVTNAGVLEFSTGNAPLLGFGEGGAQFDRRGAVDQMRNGQGGIACARTADACPSSG